MSKQIAVRLADDLVEFVDSVVAHGDQRSRAAVVTRAEILAAAGPDPDMASLADHALSTPIELQ
jgi:hypothetical protein